MSKKHHVKMIGRHNKKDKPRGPSHYRGATKGGK